MKPKSDHVAVHNRLLAVLNDHHLEQQQHTTTREGNVLDLYCTNRPTITKSTCVLPGISDHNIIVADNDIKPQHSKKPSQEFVAGFTSSLENYTVEENWSHFKDYLNAVMNDDIPSEWTSIRTHLPWLTTELK